MSTNNWCNRKVRLKSKSGIKVLWLISITSGFYAVMLLPATLKGQSLNNSLKHNSNLTTQVLVVDNLGFDGSKQICSDVNPNDCSLPGAINRAHQSTGDDLIKFDPGLNTAVIDIMSQLELFASGKLTIDGDRRITFSGRDQNRIFALSAGANLELLNLSLTRAAFPNGTGGAIYNNDGSVFLLNCSLFNNTSIGSLGKGAGIFNAGNLQVINSTITANESGEGAGIFTTLSSTTIVKNSTIAFNSASERGAGLSNPQSALVQIQSSIFSDNSAPREPNYFGSLNSLGNNLFESISGGILISSDIFGQSANLEPVLYDNGSGIKTLALQSNSPAIDHGFAGSLTEDQRGFSRTIDDPSTPNGTGDGTDCGSFERNYQTFEYSNLHTRLHSSISVTPNISPVGARRMYASTTSNFRGKISVIPTTGKIVITNPYPVGSYEVKVKAFTASEVITKTFSINVTSIGSCTVNQGTFTPSASTGVANGPISLDILDPNGNGILNFVVPSQQSGRLNIFLGDGNGGFLTQSGPQFFYGSYSVVTDDFDGNGYLDIATSRGSGQRIVIRLGDATNQFSQIKQIFGDSVPGEKIISTDFDNDGDRDLIATEPNLFTFSVYKNDGLGNFSLVNNSPIASGGNPRPIMAADFNEDGFTDIVIGNTGNNNNVSFFPGDGSGNFTQRIELAIPHSPHAFEFGYFNPDNYLDFVSLSNNPTDNLAVYLGTGLGTFAPPITSTLSGPPYALATTDFDGDQKTDLAVAVPHGSVFILKGNNDGTFQTPINYGFAGSGIVSIIVGDFDRNGKAEFAGTGYASNSLYIAKNNCQFVPTSSMISITGKVVDSAGYAVSKAKIIVVGTNGINRVAYTNQFGNFSFSDIEIGNYVIQAKSKGLHFEPLLSTFLESQEVIIKSSP